MTKRNLQVNDAIGVFVKGFCVGKSITHPYEYEQIGGVWRMFDADRKNPRDYRKEEYVAAEADPGQMDAISRRHTRGRFFICDIVATDLSVGPRRDEFKRLGYRLLATEPFFEHYLKRIPRTKSPAKVVLVDNDGLAQQLAKATRTRPLVGDYLGPLAPFRQYVAITDGQIVGWVRSINAGRSNWCSTLGVIPQFRRRGIGSALLAKMLRDDRRLKVKSSVLLASHTGALLYPQMGYVQIGTLFMYAPRKK